MRFIWWLLDAYLAGFQWYRRLRGGKWAVTYYSPIGDWANIWDRTP